MPTYDYYCERNGRTVEVSHRMSEQIASWGELCERAGIDADGTPADSPVRKLISGPAVISSGALSNPEPACSSGPCCGGGMCGLN